jgi:ubiquinone/menaquinone biosynthesis C-methylase UbiE
MRESGFRPLRVHRMTAGIVAIHAGRLPVRGLA